MLKLKRTNILNKDIHLALCDVTIETRTEYLNDETTVEQYLLGLNNINKILNTPFTKLLRQISSSRENIRNK